MKGLMTAFTTGFMLARTALFALLLAVAVAAFAQEEPPASESELRVNVNQADADTIAGVLDGIGLVRAEAIVSYREENGDFSAIEELTMVDGIGEITVRNNRDRIAFE